jgi:YidC/Oxa1 family membrane protein insertase
MDKKTVFAIILVGVIILLTPYYYMLVSPNQDVVDSVDTLAVNNNYTANPQTVTPTSTNNDVLSTPLDVQLGERSDLPWYASDPISQSESITIETPLYKAMINTRGASVESWVIKPTQAYLLEQEELVRLRDSNRNLALIAHGGLGLLRTEEKNFTASISKLNLREGDPSTDVTFTLPLGGNAYYREIYTFYSDRYDFDLRIESNGLAQLTGAASATFGWGGGLALTEQDTTQDVYYTEAYALIGKNKSKLKSNGRKAGEEIGSGPTAWVAQRTKYFLMAILAKEPAEGARLYTWPDTSYVGKNYPKLFETSLVFALNNGEINESMTIYLGPLDQETIVAVDPSLEQTISWGWKIIQPFSKGVFYVLKFLHRYISNYGIVLILFAFAVKILIWPLTQKSHKSMKRMQMLQPIMAELKIKYKDNPQKMQQETMALYKEHKVNPMGGCWPVALQMPLLYGLFIVFRSTIELRGQAFMLWISDLSMPDVLFELPFTIPLYGDHVCVLPLIMALSTFLQSKQTMTDPNQKMMLYMMPMMFIFLFNNFPSGLTLYYTLFNLLTWAQQKMMKLNDPQLAATVSDAEDAKFKEAQRIERRKQKKSRK